MSQSTPIKPRIRAMRIWRNIWGILFLLSLLWMLYGFSVSGQAYNETTAGTTDSAYNAGAAIGAGIGITTVLCIGIPIALFSLILYARNGAGIRKEKHHAEMLDAIREGKNIDL